MTITTLVAGAPVRVGSSNREAVKAVQQALRVAVDGEFGTGTLQALITFQKTHGLTPDGVVGPATAAALDALSGGAGAVQVTSRSDFGSAPVWFQLALHELGVHEVGNNAGPDIRRFIDDAHVGHQGDPWCAIFANAMLELSGIHGTRSASSQSFIGHPNFISLGGPALGAIAVFWRKSRNSGLGHVGFYRGEAGDRVYVLGGNEADAVRIEAMAKASATFGLRGYWWPKAVPLPRIATIPIRSGQPLASVKVV